MPGLSGIYVYMMVSSPFDIGVHVVALVMSLIVGLRRWPWWLPTVVAVLATLLTQKGGDPNFWLIGLPVCAIANYASFGVGRLIAGSRSAPTVG